MDETLPSLFWQDWFEYLSYQEVTNKQVIPSSVLC